MIKGVSVCIPTYNSEEFVLDALQSVIDQTVLVDEIIVCDNHSTDSTVEKVENFKSKHLSDNIQIFVNSENVGFQKNFIKCYELANRSYFLILHADDLLKPDSIQKLRDFLDKHPFLAIAAGLADRIDEQGNDIVKAKIGEPRIFEKGEIFEFVKVTRSYLPYSAVLYRKEFINEIGYLPEEAIGPDDLYWPLVLNNYSIGLINEGLIFMKEHTGQLHYKNYLKYNRLISFYIRKLEVVLAYEKNTEHRKEIIKIFNNDLSNLCITAGRSVEQYFGKFSIALIYFAKAIKFNPQNIFKKRYINNLIKTILMEFHLYPR